jgi:hypothetical protein
MGRTSAICCPGAHCTSIDGEGPVPPLSRLQARSHDWRQHRAVPVPGPGVQPALRPHHEQRGSHAHSRCVVSVGSLQRSCAPSGVKSPVWPRKALFGGDRLAQLCLLRVFGGHGRLTARRGSLSVGDVGKKPPDLDEVCMEPAPPVQRYLGCNAGEGTRLCLIQYARLHFCTQVLWGARHGHRCRSAVVRVSGTRTSAFRARNTMAGVGAPTFVRSAHRTCTAQRRCAVLRACSARRRPSARTL